MTIGVLDSGIGGLAILREIHAHLPGEDLLYIADQAHLPYGPRPLEEVQDYTEGITRYLLAQGAKLIVIACNTASAAALHPLRATFPTTPFVGLEPAIRPAAQATGNGVIGVIATAATFQGKLYASLIERFAQGTTVIARACPEFVLLAERGAPWSAADYALVADTLAGIRHAGADHLVLGCTHFSFLTPLLQAALGPAVTIVDPAPAIARRVGAVLTERAAHQKAERPPRLTLCTTGNVGVFREQVARLVGLAHASFCGLGWQDGVLR
ncbi:MAG: glutamate racemase [Anaerolineales bacterium]